ncbi:MAG: carbohydrate porin, partial [Azoarcus sp.]|nr:carbohydrate porin [Azoarcus sp.]
NGFQPGFIASYLNTRNDSEPWRLSLGIFGAGDTASNYQDTADPPLVIAQAEKTLKLFGGRTGNYRLYAWSRRDVPRFDGTSSGHHTGFGLSIDQQFGDGLTLFTRYGQLVRGRLPVDRALAVGAEIKGSYWGRADDALGIAGSWLRASKAYKRAGGEGYLNSTSFAAGTPDFTFRPSGAERVAKIYYRYYISPQFALTPDVQWIRRGGANRHADPVTILGVRANIAY